MRIGRTSLVVAFVLGLFAWSPSADAQQPRKVPLVGILSDWSRLQAPKFAEPFVQGLRDLGYVEGQTILFERRHADGKFELLPSLAAELVGLQPDVIFAHGTGAARAAKAATNTVPSSSPGSATRSVGASCRRSLGLALQWAPGTVCYV